MSAPGVARLNSRVTLRRWEKPWRPRRCCYLSRVGCRFLCHRTANYGRWRLHCHPL